ncbi:hypothetical protein [Zhihengliuella sp.]|uniref:hypothetical protein n=1 Tax=Zhihengliuella sp. TaxID=1954483 RepID=UPI0028118A97|nr:hypothetical protein [Zhihengliuella sp.]
MATTQKKTTPEKTTLDSDVTKPSTTAPGDGPADTTDSTERAQSVPPQPDEEARKVGTVNAVKPAPKPAASTRSRRKERIETYTAVRPDGTEVKVKHNLETGKTEIES